MTLAVGAVGLYVIIGLATAVLVWRSRRRPGREVSAYDFASVVVAARNEEATIGACLDALAAQDYPQDRVEFIIVDDDSTDATASIIHNRAEIDPRIRYVKSQPMPDHPPGKAASLHTGIEAARGDFLLFTDADCRPPEGWVCGIVASLQPEEVGVVGGVTRVIGGSLHARLQALDWTLLKGVAAGWSIVDRPLTAMGNNMGVRRDAYEAVGGFPALRPSVTEDYALFQTIARTGSWSVRLDPHPSIENRTLAERSFAAVFRQRRRWARGAMAASPMAAAFYILIYAAHLLPLLLLGTTPGASLIMIAAKMFADVTVIVTSSAKGRTLSNLIMTPMYELYLYAYLLILPLSLAVVPEISWKGREHHQSQSSGSAQ